MKSNRPKPPLKNSIKSEVFSSNAIQVRALLAAVSLMGLSVGAAHAQAVNASPEKGTTTSNQLKADQVKASSSQIKVGSSQIKVGSSQIKVGSNQLKASSSQIKLDSSQMKSPSSTAGKKTIREKGKKNSGGSTTPPPK
jgi:X-X-X-Leu-X-X-Gly heptad repeat protein